MFLCACHMETSEKVLLGREKAFNECFGLPHTTRFLGVWIGFSANTCAQKRRHKNPWMCEIGSVLGALTKLQKYIQIPARCPIKMVFLWLSELEFVIFAVFSQHT